MVPSRGSRRAAGGMAASHRVTDEYMAAMYRGLEGMGVDTSDDPYRGAFEPAYSTAAPSGALSVGSTLSIGVRGLSVGPPAPSVGSAPAPSWWHGPDDAAGLAYDASDRPLLCMSVHGDSAVVGSTDHGLVELNLRPCWRGEPPSRRRTLYTAAHGHTEWVTDVAHCADGRVLSAGMDSKLCLWNAAGAPRCTELRGHTGSISRVLVSADGRHALSASYDKTVRAWALGGGVGEVGSLRAHRAPVLHLVWAGQLVASADREGAVLSWDVEAGVATSLGRHGGHATALAPLGGAACLASGGQDGRVCIYDCRLAGCAAAVASAAVHTGAVDDLLAHTPPGGGPEMLLSTGADRSLLVLEPRRSLAVLHRSTHHRDFVYSLAAVGGLALTGGGDGMVLVHEVSSGELLYGLSAGRAAVRAMHATPHRLVCAGDDGDVAVYTFDAGAAAAEPGSTATRAALPARPPSHGRRAAALRPPEPNGAPATPMSEAQKFAEKKRLAMERAAQLRADRQLAAAGGGGTACGPHSELDTLNALGDHKFGRADAPPPSELDMLHALGDRKFGRRGHGR
eukprot:scaffold44652_cov30-Tisochrysis_lutea.AAC.1